MKMRWNAKGHLVVKDILNESMFDTVNAIVDDAELDVDWTECNTVATIICAGKSDADRLMVSWNNEIA